MFKRDGLSCVCEDRMCGGGSLERKNNKRQKGGELCGLALLSVNPHLPPWGHDGMSAGAAGPGLPAAPAVPHADVLL